MLLVADDLDARYVDLRLAIDAVLRGKKQL